MSRSSVLGVVGALFWSLLTLGWGVVFIIERHKGEDSDHAAVMGLLCLIMSQVVGGKHE